MISLYELETSGQVVTLLQPMSQVVQTISTRQHLTLLSSKTIQLTKLLQTAYQQKTAIHLHTVVVMILARLTLGITQELLMGLSGTVIQLGLMRGIE